MKRCRHWITSLISICLRKRIEIPDIQSGSTDRPGRDSEEKELCAELNALSEKQYALEGQMQAMIDEVRTDARLRILIVNHYPLWRMPEKPYENRGF